MEKRELVIIGAGPAGLTAAIYGRRAGLDVLLLEKGLPGGQINITDEIENWPGVIHSSGAELGQSFRKHAEHFKTEFRDCTVKGIEIRNGSKVVVTDKGEVEAEAIILATGAAFVKLGCKGEAEFTGAGVSYCAVCDAAFFEDEVVAVVGGGNVAVEEAGYLTRFASKVYLIHRRDVFRADRHAIEQALANPKIEPIYNTVVESIEGADLVEKLMLKNVKTGEKSELPVAGVFIFIGTEPIVDFLGEPGSLIKQTRGNWIETNEKMETSVEGIFAAGDLRDKPLRQVVTAAGDGAVAAMSAYSYITEQLHIESMLYQPEHVFALFSSSIDQEHMRLQAQAEQFAADNGVDLSLICAYKNKRIVEKLGLAALPAVVEFKKGEIVRQSQVASLAQLEEFIKGK
ncbi:thioredoxin-disulfide reductase [Synergistaceae bacterium OttesenSCG-928-D05]|nr:thioredoxin-disulfide reductase [Synergistaceae bacterium OttesenSCG-928-D05]